MCSLWQDFHLPAESRLGSLRGRVLSSLFPTHRMQPSTKQKQIRALQFQPPYYFLACGCQTLSRASVRVCKAEAVSTWETLWRLSWLSRLRSLQGFPFSLPGRNLLSSRVITLMTSHELNASTFPLAYYKQKCKASHF